MKVYINIILKPLLLIALFAFGATQNGNSQSNNYIQLFDYSGEPNTNYINDLQIAADSLVAAFPTAYQDSFKVYDFGFYLHQEDYDGFSYPEEFVKVVRDLDSKYYLAFGRQTDESVLNTKTFVDIVLPTQGDFSCLDLISPDLRDDIITKYHIQINNLVNAGNNVYNSEVQVIETFTQHVLDIVECCDPGRSTTSCGPCLYTLEEIINFLENKDFLKIPIQIDESNTLGEDFCEAPLNIMGGSPRNSSIIVNEVNYSITIEGDQWSLFDSLSNALPSVSPNLKYYICDLSAVSSNKFFTYLNEIYENKGGVMYFILNSSSDTYLYISKSNIDIRYYEDPVFLNDYYADILASNNCDDCPDWFAEGWNSDYDSGEGSITLTYVAPAIPLAGVDGPVPAADAIIAAALAAAATADAALRTYITYVAYNPLLNAHYSGRSSGYGTPEEILWKRLIKHHFVSNGYDTNVDKSAQSWPSGYWLVRGREQQLIDFYGGALSDPERRPAATCVNAIRGVSKWNPNGYFYHWLSTSVWGEKYPYTGTNTEDINEALKTVRNYVKNWIKKLY